MSVPDRGPRLIAAAPFLLTLLYLLLALPMLRDETARPAVLAASALLGAALIWLSLIDIRTMRLPDAITLPLIVSGPAVAFALAGASVVWHAGSAAAGFLFLYLIARGYRALRGRDGLGLGDAKLFAAAGAWLGLEGLPSVMLWGSGAALVTVLAISLLHRPLSASSRLPFGPFIALGFWLVWLYGPAA
jgi:leader peptidase (prepilin peptidase) / N-methyltransferase